MLDKERFDLYSLTLSCDLQLYITIRPDCPETIKQLSQTLTLSTRIEMTMRTGFLMEMGQWRRQDLLRGGAKLEIMSWGTHGKLQGRVQQLLDG